MMQSSDPRPRFFALKATAGLGQDIAAALGQPLSLHEERSFEDGEHKSRPMESVAGAGIWFGAVELCEGLNVCVVRFGS